VFNIEWLASYEIGVPEIDDDHKALLKSLTAIKDAFADRDYGVCRSLVADFVSKAESHLEWEEALLRDTGYPGADSHAERHAELFARVAEIRDVCSGELEPWALAGQLDALAAVVMTDLIGGDLEFKSFLHDRGTAETL